MPCREPSHYSDALRGRDADRRMPMTFTGAIGAVCMFPLRAIINASRRARIHPNVLTLIGVLINVVAGVGARRRTASCWPASS